MQQQRSELEHMALRVREHVIRMAAGGGCFIGASLSCADLLVYLYQEILQVSPATMNDPSRDYLLLSKGHDVPALYGVLAEIGFIEKARLRNHLKTNDSLYWHPNRDVAGVEFHSGSLGHLLAVGIGIALDIKLRGGANRVFVLLGDGELNEGSIWEACLVAGAQRLDNLVAIVDRNGFQANERTEILMPLEPLAHKFDSFGWAVTSLDGHCFAEMDSVFNQLPFVQDRPNVVIARTVRGKGLPSIEARADRWFARFSDAEIEMLIEELHSGQLSNLTSDTMLVR